jgi:predicted DCC family thiol-disulfide oxidoreductase YuxK
MPYKIYLIYDSECPFCVHIAHILEHLIYVENLKTIPNTSKRALKINRKLSRKKILKDVHAVVVNKDKSSEIYTGADAVAKILSCKSGNSYIWAIHSKFPYLFRIIYYISKKIRKFIHNYSSN